MITSKNRENKRGSASTNQEAERKAEQKIRVFTCVFKVDKVVHWRITNGRAFHRFGPATLKAPSPMVRSRDMGTAK